ncbi:hypothetical protein CC1G_14724 [Coprinopsis cinerea okayama7|uniref:Uncharacterized protein n=1 Tax=Coprinopsis cinerea (strain Okayama-7 / 130 / ATCC MYA-4618 / FGSC 9003) TaxID=240176 RepID=D6RN13_COPC7|nr:hypothetical protein CC1G_14724 [Coprinopsis cinerea okayama7\|eukprot:XP_002911295.1 hypothetical protein CC1G_14724 [Coprinopsis cinerea okayama7\
MASTGKRKQTEEDQSSYSQQKKARTNEDQDGTDSGPSSAGTSKPESKEHTDLQTLLDFTALESQDEISARFDAISRALLHDYVLVVTRADGTTTHLQVMEHEFYLQKATCHEDPFAHGSEEQRVLGQWYFHRAPRYSADSNRSLTSSDAYRGGTRKGLDLTFGRPAGTKGEETLLRGGILLRSIRVLGSKSKVVSGPSLLVDQILSFSGSSGIPDLVQTKWGGDISAFRERTAGGTSLCVVSRSLLNMPASSTKPPTIYTSPRIGLELSHPGTTSPKIKPLHSRIRFLTRKYRYFVSPHELIANGRSQTFVGLLFHFTQNQNQKNKSNYASMDEALGRQSMKLLGDVCRTMGLKEGTAKKYLADFRAGREGGEEVLEGFVGPQGKGAAGSPASYLTMVGAVSVVVGEQ